MERAGAVHLTMADMSRYDATKPNPWSECRAEACRLAEEALLREAWVLFSIEERPKDLVVFLAWQGWSAARDEHVAADGPFGKVLEASIERELQKLLALLGEVGA